jgi:hypothetical protein
MDRLGNGYLGLDLDDVSQFMHTDVRMLLRTIGPVELFRMGVRNAGYKINSDLERRLNHRNKKQKYTSPFSPFSAQE